MKRKGPSPRPLKERFEKKYIKTKTCWLWTACKSKNGYGRCEGEWAHRIAWRLYRGNIPEGMYVCHKCDVTACVNPDHLFLGTQSDNVRDSINKGRKAVGEASHAAKLSNKQVQDIRSRRLTGNEFAALYKIHKGHVYNIWGNWSRQHDQP